MMGLYASARTLLLHFPPGSLGQHAKDDWIPTDVIACEQIDLRSRLERREDQPGLLLQDAIVRDVRQQGRLFRVRDRKARRR